MRLYSELVFVDSKACPVLDTGTLKLGHNWLCNGFSNVAKEGAWNKLSIWRRIFIRIQDVETGT
ncbi:hypothetical protein [Methyloprofundus sp.]|uniref:hypothetical protein n=1 Tax=Methyloprofundus sp. TaxID=2020875 RepID=UPI003D0AEA12